LYKGNPELCRALGRGLGVPKKKTVRCFTTGGRGRNEGEIYGGGTWGDKGWQWVDTKEGIAGKQEARLARIQKGLVGSGKLQSSVSTFLPKT